MSRANEVWRVRAASANDDGCATTRARLADAINAGEVGDLDSVRGPHDSDFIAVGEHPIMAEFLPSQRAPWDIEAEDAESDLTPMIDVTFQLVIFFMIAATFTIQKTLDLPLGKPESEGASTTTIEQLAEANIMVKIAADGAVTIGDKPTPVDALETGLREALRSAANAEVVLDVADDAQHDVLVKVMDAAGAAQIEKVLFVSRVKTPPGAASARGP